MQVHDRVRDPRTVEETVDGRPEDVAVAHVHGDRRKAGQVEPDRADAGVSRRVRRGPPPAPGSPYVACSRHHEALAPYRSSLAPEQQLVVVLERLRADPAAELDRVLRSVGVDPSRGPVPRRTRVPAPAGPTLDAATRAAFADAVGDDVAALRTWLDDALPEWA